MPTNFIYDNTGLPVAKINAGPLPPGVDPTKWLQGSEWDTVMQALFDVQAFCRGANWFGIAEQVADPAPSGISHYIWVRSSDGKLMLNGSALAGSGTVTSVSTGTGLIGGPITGAGTIALANTTVTPGTYTYVTLTVDAQGRITAAANGTPPSNIFVAGAGANSAIQSGGTNTAAGANALAEGSNNAASGTASHAEGNGTTASGNYSHSQNLSTTASGIASDAGGDTSVASGYASFARGKSNTATGDQSTVLGAQSVALREMQWTHGSGCFSVNGDAQASQIEFRGSTPGAGTSESVELKFGLGGTPTDVFSCEDGKAYFMEVDCIVGGTQSGGAVRLCKMFKRRYLLRRASGLTTLAGTGSQDDIDDTTAGTTTWTLTASINATPDRFALTFNTGAGNPSLCHIVAKVAFTEVAF